MVRSSPDSLLIQINLKSPAVQIASKSSTVGGSGQPWSAYVIRPEHNKKNALPSLTLWQDLRIIAEAEACWIQKSKISA